MGFVGLAIARIGIVPAFCAFGLLAGCAPDEGGDYLRIGGGGFVFNYRIAEATAGIIAEPKRPLPDDARIIAVFENPTGGPPIALEKTVSEGRKHYSFSTPVKGVEADRPYSISVQLIEQDGTVIQTLETTIHSDIDQTILPEEPLTIGPGYHRNPELAGE